MTTHNRNLTQEVANARLSEAAELGGPRFPRSCVTADDVYRPLFNDEQYDLFIRAAEELPQWVEHLTREEFLETVPGSDTECLGGERHYTFLQAIAMCKSQNCMLSRIHPLVDKTP